MPAIEFVTQSRQETDNRAATTERLVNFYPEPLPDGARARFSLRSVPGTQAWGTTGGVFVRAIGMVPDLANGSADRVFAVSAGAVKRFNEAGTGVEIGTVPNDENTTLSGNNGNVTVCAGGQYWLYDGSTFTQPAAGAFSDFGSVEFLRGYTVLTERNGRRIQWSALADASSLPGLNFATAEARDDIILRAVSIGGNLWVFKTTSIEIWQVTGQASENAFTTIPGLLIERGLRGFNLIAKFRGGAFFIGSDDVPYIAAGTVTRAVANLGVQTALANNDPTHCFYYEDEGHQFLVIRFSDRPAWVFDLATGLWHERAIGENDPWSATGAVRAFGSWRTAQEDGTLRTLTRSNVDVEGALIRRAVSQQIYNGGERFRVPKLEITGRVGRSDLGREARLGLRVTRDGGNTFGALVERDMGALGEYEQRMVFRPMGQQRSFAVEARVSDPADLTVFSSANVVLA
jgi:hypothetical protein